MTDAIRAAFADCRPVKSRGCWQFIFEVPTEQAKAALDLLGIPDPGKETWCGIAVLKNDSAVASALDAETRGTKIPEMVPEAGSGATGRPALTDGEKLVQQAGILCNDERFWVWLFNDGVYASAISEHSTADWLRRHLGIASRRELATNETAAEKFRALVVRYKSETGQMAEPRG